MFPHDSGLLQWARSLALEQLRAEALRRRAPPSPRCLGIQPGPIFFLGLAKHAFCFPPFWLCFHPLAQNHDCVLSEFFVNPMIIFDC